MPQRTGRPNIGHATGRGVLLDGRINNGAMLVEEEALPYAGDYTFFSFSFMLTFT
ncbi:hypothetical protein [Evansella tamaricis]|uniref:Uncharacterized protein n=1 Tax=Evansella tamaricis TaxID=2069301 RepID=A0ABS6JCH8_9BACI|nr:hypothetical protein [Evansella tamaricis]MBU9711377.1 hypothetical protein [Evansella tamaricis]